MLSSVYCDIMVFSEIKLDDAIPDKLYEHPDFFLIRRNRTMSGGGILIYIRKSYKILDLFISTEFELISFKLKIGKVFKNFIFSYKPPSTKDDEFLEYLDTRVKAMDMNNELFIGGDLNMDWLSQKGSRLK